MQLAAKLGTALAGRRVLVVEDEYFIADDIARSLRRLGAEVVGPVASRGEALDIVASGQRIDAAVLDINLRGETIYPLADALRGRNVPVVFATGYDLASIPEEYRSIPRWEKPFDPQALAERLTALAGPPEKPFGHRSDERPDR